MRISKNHLGIGFEVWNYQSSWFWLVDNTNRNGMIGAAATESDAIAEAHSSIEEISEFVRAPRLGMLARKARAISRFGLRRDRVRTRCLSGAHSEKRRNLESAK